MEMNFCRRCGAPLTPQEGSAYTCSNGHTVFAIPIPAALAVMVNEANEVLVTIRAREPGKGGYALPGGFCEANETIETAFAREVEEELGLKPDNYTTPEFFCTLVHDYLWQDSVQISLDCVFIARLKGTPTLHMDEEATKFMFMKPQDVPREKLAFKEYAQVFDKLAEKLG